MCGIKTGGHRGPPLRFSLFNRYACICWHNLNIGVTHIKLKLCSVGIFINGFLGSVVFCPANFYCFTVCYVVAFSASHGFNFLSAFVLAIVKVVVFKVIHNYILCRKHIPCLRHMLFLAYVSCIYLFFGIVYKPNSIFIRIRKRDICCTFTVFQIKFFNTVGGVFFVCCSSVAFFLY